MKKTQRVNIRKKKPKSITKLKAELDSVFSLYIRTKYSRDGYVSCFTCGIKKTIKEMQNGHYIPRNHLATRYLELNNHPQCVGCNVFKNGNMSSYAVRLEEKYGQGVLQDLEKLKRSIIKDLPYADLIEVYEERLSALQ